MNMRILHLFSNWKWTGPAEHALQLSLALSRRGHDVVFACGKAPPHAIDDSIERAARDRGLAPTCDFRLNKHFNVFHNLEDLRSLTPYLKGQGFDLVHTHMRNDHFLAGLATRRLPRRPRIVRTLYDATLTGGMRNRLLLTRLTDRLVTVSEGARREATEALKISPSKVFKIHTPVDCSRFDPSAKLRSTRPFWKIGTSDFVVGIVARIQKHRRFDVFLDAVAIAVREIPNLKALIIGRGTHQEEIASEGVRKRGLTSAVIMTGYLREDYVETLNSINVEVFLVPGTDGSCRAVKEAMALGKPVIAARRGMLPEIVEDGKSGLIIDDSPLNLANAILKVARDEPLRGRMGEQAYLRAREEFDLEKQAEKVETVYRGVQQ